MPTDWRSAYRDSLKRSRELIGENATLKAELSKMRTLSSPNDYQKETIFLLKSERNGLASLVLALQDGFCGTIDKERIIKIQTWAKVKESKP